MTNWRSSAFSWIVLAWLLLLGIICVISILPIDYGTFSHLRDLIVFLSIPAPCVFASLAQREYKKLDHTHKAFIWRGAILSAISALIGNLIFVVIDTITLTIHLGWDFLLLDLKFMLLIIAFTSCMASIPSFVTGLILAFALLQDALNGKASIKGSIAKGLALGTLLGISLCIAMYIFINYRADFYIWLQRTVLVTIIAALAGSWTGWRLGKSITQINTTSTNS